MKKIFFVIAFLAVTIGQAQIFEPVKWTTAVTKISDTEYELVATATIKPNWHLYSQTVPENGPLATSFSFGSSPKYLKKGNTIEDKGTIIYDPIFALKIKFFEKKASFRQRIKLKTKTPLKVNAKVEFMVCDDNRCLPPTELDLVFNIN